MIIKLEYKHSSGHHFCGRYYLNGKLLTPEKSQGIRCHSPDGFNHGYLGSGPAQLALAILLELTDKEVALKKYHHFKEEIIAALPQNKSFNIDIEISSHYLEILTEFKDPFFPAETNDVYFKGQFITK